MSNIDDVDIIRQLKSLLISAGLTEAEIVFYVQVLKKPRSSIWDIAKRAGLPKDRAYKIFFALQEKGFLSFETIGKSKIISPLPLNEFIENMYGRGNKFYRIADSLKSIQPFFKYLNLPDPEGSISFLDSSRLAEDWVDLSYINWENVLVYGDFEMMINHMGVSADNEFMNRRLKRGKKAFPLLANPGAYTLDLAQRDYKEMRNTKIIHDEKLKNYFVCLLPDNDTVAVWMKDKDGLLKGVKIKNYVLTRLQEQTFNYLDSIAVKP